MKVPVDGIIQDWQYWPSGNNTWGSHLFDPTRYPDPAGMFKELHDDALPRARFPSGPKFDLGSDNSKELNAVGGMFPQVTRYVFPPGQGQWYDPFSAKGREIYWKQMRDQLFAKGVDGWWLDAPEPEINGMSCALTPPAMGPGYEVYNAYPLMHSTGIYQGQRATTDQKRVVILTRSAYAGQQRNSAITWSGDIQGDWQVFRNQIPAGLNFSLSGIPYWNTDTGGFFGNRPAGNGDPTNPQYQETILALVSVQRLLPDVPRTRFLRPESGQGNLAFRREDPRQSCDLSGLALSPAALSVLDAPGR